MNLYESVWENDEITTQRLLDAGADINESFDGLTPLYAAIENTSLGCLTILLKRGADLEQEVRGFSPLNWAIDVEIDASTGNRWEFGHFDGDVLRPLPMITGPLLRAGADPHCVDSSGSSPAQAAEERGHRSFQELLSKFGKEEKKPADSPIPPGMAHSRH